jgi:hypothetical protein
VRANCEDTARDHKLMTAFVTGIAWVLASFLLIDVFVVLTTGLLGMQSALAVIRNTHLLWVLPGLCVGLTTWVLGIRALLPGLFGALLGYVATINSRGIWIWPSTFDYYWERDVRWKSVLLVGLLVGAFIGVVLGLKRPLLGDVSSKRLQRVASASCWVLVGMVLIYIAVSPLSKAESLFPALRPVYVGTLAVVLVVATIVTASKLEHSHE